MHNLETQQRSSEFDQLKLAFYKGRSQLFIFEDNGNVLQSCDSILNVAKGVNIFDSTPFLESIKSEINTLEVHQKSDYKRINTDFFGNGVIYDFLLKKVKWKNDIVNLLLIEDQHESNQYLIEMQQGRNDSMLHNEIIEEKSKIIEQNNRELASTLSALTRAQISKKALFITFLIVIVLVLLSEGLVDPAIETYTGSFWIAMLGKLFIALLIKPVDLIMEKILMRQAVRKLGKAKN